MTAFALLILTAILAGIAIPLSAIIAALLGFCEPFSLTIWGKSFVFGTAREQDRDEIYVPPGTYEVSGPLSRDLGGYEILCSTIRAHSN